MASHCHSTSTSPGREEGEGVRVAEDQGERHVKFPDRPHLDCLSHLVVIWVGVAKHDE